jgi:hypothetical protein
MESILETKKSILWNSKNIMNNILDLFITLKFKKEPLYCFSVYAVFFTYTGFSQSGLFDGTLLNSVEFNSNAFGISLSIAILLV